MPLICLERGFALLENSNEYKKTMTETSVDRAAVPPSGGTSQLVICPYLALFDDPDTKLLYPSPAGYCHHVTPEQAINLEHQQSFCLNAQHMICSAFVTEDLQALPAGLERQFIGENGRSARIIMLIVALVAAGLLGLWIFGGNDGADMVVNNADGNNSSMAAIVLTTTVPTETSVPAMTATPKPTDIPPSPTPLPSPTSIPTVTPAPLPTAEPTSPPTLIPSPTSEPLPVAEVIPGRLNIRGGPSTDYPVLMVVDTGTLFDVVGQLSDGTWYQLCCVGDDNTFGWVLMESVNITGLVAEIPVVTNIPPLSEN